jgi:hypothetical protein
LKTSSSKLANNRQEKLFINPGNFKLNISTVSDLLFCLVQVSLTNVSDVYQRTTRQPTTDLQTNPQTNQPFSYPTKEITIHPTTHPTMERTKTNQTYNTRKNQTTTQKRTKAAEHKTK